MKKSVVSRELTSFNRAAFRLSIDAVRNGRLELLLEETLAKVLGGEGTTCTTFTCSVYAPPPPGGG